MFVLAEKGHYEKGERKSALWKTRMLSKEHCVAVLTKDRKLPKVLELP